MIELEKYKAYLKRSQWSKKTQQAYYEGVYYFTLHYSEINSYTLNQWRDYMQAHYKPSTTNLFIRGMNCYLSWSRSRLKMKSVLEPHTTRLERIFSKRDYIHLCKSLLNDCEYTWYMYVRLAATVGGRPGDILKITHEDIIRGSKDILSKRRWRTIYIPKTVQKEYISIKDHLDKNLWTRSTGEKFTQSYVRSGLKTLAKRYGLNDTLFYPYAFRHFFGKSFIANKGDITLLKDLLGHCNIQTTSIYTRLTMQEQKQRVDHIVQW